MSNSRFQELLMGGALLCAWFAMAAVAAAQATATLGGRVTDSTEAALPRAQVTLRGGSGERSTTAGADGEFQFDGIQPGAYRLSVESAGLAPDEREIILTPGQTLSLTITLRPPSLTQSVEVTATADAVSGSVMKMDAPLLETPQSITIISQETLQQQRPLSFQEALRYVAGVSTDLYGFDPRGDWAAVRGDEYWGQYLNGLRMLFGYNNNTRPDVFALERLEVMRGPSSVLFGQSGFGGVINLVSKRPQPQHRREVEVQLGTYRRRQVAFDVTGPFDDDAKFLYRVVGVGRDSNTQVDHVPDDRLLFAPSLTWRPRTGTSFTVLTNFQKDESGSSLGFFPWQGTLYPNPGGQIPTNTFISEPNFDGYDTDQAAAGYLLQHQFNSRWTLRQNFNYTESSANYQTVYSRFDPGPVLNEDNRTINREIYIDYAKARSPVIDTQMETHFTTGAFRHNVLFGVDYQQSTINDQWGYDFAPPIDIFEPVYGNFTVPPINSTPEARQNQVGVYGQDHIEFSEHWSVMLGIRRDRASSESEGDLESEIDTATTGRAGLVYTTSFGLAPYFSFSQSFSPLAGTDINNNPYDPIRAKQFEAGAKFQPGGSENLLGVALFDIREQNRLTPDPTNPLNSIQVGEAHIRGIELEARTKPFWGLNLIFNYNFLDARISKSNDVDMGKRIGVIPKHYGSMWAVKDFRFQGLPGFFSAGGGIRYNGSTFGGDDVIKAPSYTLYDLMLSYDTMRWRFALNVANLTDETYLASCLSRGDCFFGMRRSIVTSIGYRF